MIKSTNNDRRNHYEYSSPFLAVCAVVLAGGVQAGTLSCGSAMIIDGQPNHPFYKQQVLEQCGEPTSKDGDDWFYDRSDVGQGLYVLHFNDGGKLESIKEQ